jgi:hypothetical protein
VTLDVYPDWEPCAVVQIQLSQCNSFWKRVWHAIKYVFKAKTSDHGHWDTVMLSHDNLLKLREFCERSVDAVIEHRLKTVQFQPQIQTRQLTKTN